jgi:DNA-binding NtrC family response regulator
MNNPRLIFIVDDDPVINTLVLRNLTSEGYTVEAFESGEECLGALDKRPDLIILDYFFVNNNVELMNGMEIFNKIKEMHPEIPVIMLSGQGKGEIVLELARRGIDDYIIKDNNLVENLSKAVSDYFNPE